MGTKKKANRRTSNATVILKGTVGKSVRLQQLIAKERANASVARQIYKARTDQRLSQTALADMIGTTQSVIARLEDADYDGHSLSMLRRIAAALDREVEVRFVPTHEFADARHAIE